MKKWMIVLLITIAVLLGIMYMLIPNIAKLQTHTAIKATTPAISRMLLDKNNVARWWPGKIGNDSLYLHELSYKINKNENTVFPVVISGDKIELSTSLFLVSIGNDSTHLEWVGSMPTSFNPVKRLQTYLQAKKINGDMTAILHKIEKFSSDPVNLYGIQIEHALVADSFLIATSGKCKGYPNNQFIYELVNKLRLYAAQNSATESGFPMLNVGTPDSISYEVKVAIPTSKLLMSKGDILQKRMLGNGNILVTEVTGGIGTTTNGMEQLKNYSKDHGYISPAIPFFSLLTDRTKETDSSKWVTKIYVPVM